MSDQDLNLQDLLRRSFAPTENGITDQYLQIGPMTKFGLQIARGLIPGYEHIRVVGNNPDVSTSNEENITNITGLNTFYPYPTSASAFTVVSTSANDTLAGTGAQKIILKTIDASGDRAADIEVDMDGTSNVVTSETGIRINSGYVSQAGTARANVGTITISHGATVLAQIDPNRGETKNAIRRIPNGFEGYIDLFWATISTSTTSAGAKEGTVYLNKIESSSAKIELESKTIKSDGSGAFFHLFPVPLIIPAGADVELSCATINNNSSFRGGFNLYLRSTS